MFTVALIGPDGAGKSTITQRLRHENALPIKYIYMGINPGAGNYMLPTTRFLNRAKRALHMQSHQSGPRGSVTAPPRSKSWLNNALRSIKSTLLVTNLMIDEWYRQGIAWYFLRRKNIVVFDRHFFVDYYHYDVIDTGEDKPWIRRVHGFMLKHIYPKPQLVICLDAPAEVLFARKQEGTVELLEDRRQAYLGMRHLFPHFVTVDATQPIDDVYARIIAILRNFSAEK